MKYFSIDSILYTYYFNCILRTLFTYDTFKKLTQM